MVVCVLYITNTTAMCCRDRSSKGTIFLYWGFNSYVLYKKNNGKLCRLNFLLECVEEIVEQYANHQEHVSDVQIGRPTKCTKPTRLIGKHFPNFIPATTSKPNPLRRCAFCLKNGKRKESRFWCTKCEVALCVVPCFEKYHTK